MRVAGGIALALLALAGSASAQQEGAAAPSSVERYTLANGLEVVLAPDPASPRVALVLCYRAGSSSDPEGLSGLAHLAEHMAFRGTRHLGDEEEFALPQRWGATQWGGATQAERTLYWTLVPAQQLPRVLWLESERMAFTLAAMSERHVELEHGIIRNEHELRNGSRQGVSDLVSELSYPEGHPLRSFAGAWAELDVEDIDLAAVQWFYQRVYRPDNASLVLTGGFDREEARALIAHAFAGLRNPAVARIETPPQPVEFQGVARARIASALTSETLQMIWTLPVGAIDKRRVALLGSLQLLEKGLREALAHGSKIPADIQLGVERSSGGDRVVLSVTTSRLGQLPQIESAVELGLNRLRSQPITESVLRALRRQLSWTLLLERESSLRHAFLLALDRPAAGTSGLDLAAISASTGALDAAALQAAVEELLPTERRLIVEVTAPRGYWPNPLVLSVEGRLF